MAVMHHVQGRCGLICCVPGDEVDRQMNLSDADFMIQANARFGSRLGRFLKIGSRSSYPLKLVS